MFFPDAEQLCAPIAPLLCVAADIRSDEWLFGARLTPVTGVGKPETRRDSPNVVQLRRAFSIENCQPLFLIVDEAYCMNQWGVISGLGWRSATVDCQANNQNVLEDFGDWNAMRGPLERRSKRFLTIRRRPQTVFLAGKSSEWSCS